MKHDQLQELCIGQCEPEGYSVWFMQSDLTVHPAFDRNSVAPELYDAMSAMPTMYQELSRQQLVCQAMVSVVDTAERMIAQGGTAVLDLNALRETMQQMIQGMQTAQMVAQLGVNKFEAAFKKEQQLKAKK